MGFEHRSDREGVSPSGGPLGLATSTLANNILVVAGQPVLRVVVVRGAIVGHHSPLISMLAPASFEVAGQSVANSSTTTDLMPCTGTRP